MGAVSQETRRKWVAAELLERRRDLREAERARVAEAALAMPLPESFMIESQYRVAIMADLLGS